MRRASVVAAALFGLAGCAPQAALLKDTPSGRAEATFPGASVEDVQNLLANRCSDNGTFVEQSSGGQVVCSKTMEGSQAIFAQALMGNSYSTTPEQKVRFSLSRVADGVRVVAYQWMETQMAFGQMRRQELNANNQRNDLQQMLWNLGGK